MLEASQLTSRRHIALTDAECAAIRMVGENLKQVGLSATLWLADPFTVWVNGNGGCAHWVGRTLPGPLGTLGAFTHVAEYCGSVRFCPIEIGLEPQELEEEWVDRDAVAYAQFSTDDVTSLERFASELRKARHL